MQEDLKNIQNQLNSIESKLDNHLERLSKAESNIDWLKGSVKLVFTLVLSLVTSLAGWFIKTH